MGKKIIVGLSGAIVLILLQLSFCNHLIEETSKSKIYDSIEAMPDKKVALVLGTSKYLWGERLNLYFKYRIEKTVELYKAGKIQMIIVSGDNSSKFYDEPTMMKADLVAKGIPSQKIFCDYAGFSTYDSVVRAKKIFGVTSMVVVSQAFHLKRAMYIAERNRINSIGFAAKDVPKSYNPTGELRESLARVYAVFDVCRNANPKFLGEKIEILNEF